jgi:serine/threonine protein phosphatase 1
LNLFTRLLRRKPARQGIALEGRRVFAVGDIHGCNDLLDGLVEAILREVEGDERPPLLIFLGDYVDRGPGSRQVIERLIALKDQAPGVRFLCGNHEEAMLHFLNDLEAGMAWTGYGGKATMTSYGVTLPQDETSLEAWEATHEALKAAIPESHMRFLWGLEDRIDLGDYLFVHAGVNPDRPLNAQNAKDLRWIREPFLSDGRRLEKVIVHGHTPATEPHCDARRIGIDTWAYRTGVLTALELDGPDRRYLQARRDEAGAVTISTLAADDDQD